MALLPWFASRDVVAALWMAASAAAPDTATPIDKMDAYIKDLPQERRSWLVESYAWASVMSPGILKYRTPPQIYVTCPEGGCAPAAMGSLKTLQSYAPGAIGQLTGAADNSGIEVYMAPEPEEFTRRDHDTDTLLRLNAHITAKTIVNFGPAAFGHVAAPCWTVMYYDKRTGVIKKSLIYIDSDAASHLQSLCMAFELVRASGVMNTLGVHLYHKIKPPASTYVLGLAVTAYLHGLPAIRPGDKYEQVLSVLENRYGLTGSPQAHD